ncbi:recombinase [Anaerococcus nagyae]|uniref:recombinase n=1 Tax=Anaerococcus nagyae TaxID=1755241 RepID=UPI001FE37F44|nr:recombinase [Anaerococcus nagyae]
MVGRIDKEGTIHPYDLTFYFKTGVNDSQDSDKRENAKDNNINKLCSYNDDEEEKLFSNKRATHVETICLLSK